MNPRISEMDEASEQPVGGALAPPRTPSGTGTTVRAYADLLRLKFFFAWPLLFCAGIVLGTSVYGGFSFLLIIHGALIGFFGFEAGLVLNDYIDRDLDKRDVGNSRLTQYWRLFGKRPLPAGSLPPQAAFRLFAALFAVTVFLIAFLPFPHSWYVFLILIYSYGMEAFYQYAKRTQRLPVAQLLGRTDFALFPVAGYLCAGYPDATALAFFLFFYPFAMAHLGVNDLADVENDRLKNLKTIPVLFGRDGTIYWIFGFSLLQILGAAIFFPYLGLPAKIGLIAGLLLIGAADCLIFLRRGPEAAVQALPFYHISLVIYAATILISALP